MIPDFIDATVSLGMIKPPNRMFYGPCPDWLAGKDRDRPELVIGHEVGIDGRRWEIVGIERYMVNKPYQLGETIGLQVKPIE